MYVDSNIFISPLIYEDSKKVSACRKFLGKIERREVVAFTSSLTWDEVVWVVMKTLGKADSVQAGQKLISFPNLRFVPASEDIIRASQELLSQHELAPRDAIHIASAIGRSVDAIVSDDQRLYVPAGLERLGSGSFDG